MRRKSDLLATLSLGLTLGVSSAALTAQSSNAFRPDSTPLQKPAGIIPEPKSDLTPEMRGDMYRAPGIREIPKNLRDAAALMHGSKMLRAALGDDVVDHYHHACQWEIAETDRVVTDFELQRLLERA